MRRTRGVATLAALVALVVGCAPVEQPSGPPPADLSALADAVPSPSSSTSPSAPPSSVPRPLVAAPVVTTKTVTETKRIGFKTRTVTDSGLEKGTRRTRTKGVDGVRTLTYEVTLTDGRQTARRLVSDQVTRKPVTKVVVVGTKEESTRRCDPNYSGCVPIASDVDCAGGSGNGPAYVDGPVDVIGNDVYGLDADDDGVGCE